MAVSASIYLLTREQYESHHLHQIFEENFVKQSEGRIDDEELIDFGHVVHEPYKLYWLCDRTWVIEDFLRPLRIGCCYKVSKQQLLDMIPKALEYVQEEGVIRYKETVEHYIKKLNDLKEQLATFNEETHTLIIYSL